MLPLRAGPLEMLFDCTNAFLRRIQFADREVIRGIFGAVRDANWGTVEPKVRVVDVESRADSFRVRFEVECDEGEIDFAWRGEIEGAANGCLTYRFDGTARKSFLRNRIGLCVLHPSVECAGKECEVEFVDRRSIHSRFPEFISPEQPFKNVRAISHQIADGLSAKVLFEGDIFEMEDQRNWTDASFKTYSTPLELPFPVEVRTGERVRQSVTVSLEGETPPVPRRERASLSMKVGWGGIRTLPSIGFGIGDPSSSLNSKVLEELRAIGPAHLRCDLRLSRSDWRTQLSRATVVARAVDARLQVALFIGQNPEEQLDELVTEAQQPGSPIALWMIFSEGKKVSDWSHVELARARLQRLGSDVVLAAGTDAYFAELNRNRPPAELPALPCFSINPQVHAFDNLSLVETLGAQPDTVRTPQQFCLKPVVISPITLRPRFNPNATRETGTGEPESDPRQASGFAAAWTVGTLARLATCPGVESLTFYEIAGRRGIMGNDGTLYPVGQVFAALQGWESAVECLSTEPLSVGGLALTRNDGSKRLLVAGFSPEPKEIVIEGIESPAVRVSELCASGFQPRRVAAGGDQFKLEIPAESVVLIDFTR